MDRLKGWEFDSLLLDLDRREEAGRKQAIKDAFTVEEVIK